jgi:hypothetical protein
MDDGDIRSRPHRFYQHSLSVSRWTREKDEFAFLASGENMPLIVRSGTDLVGFASKWAREWM